MTIMVRWLLGLLLVAWASNGSAQTYPGSPIRILVPIAAGSVTDVIARAASLELSKRLGQQVVIENRPGANGILAATACARAQPDGYTLCLVYHNTMSINPLTLDKLPYDPVKDFAPITSLYLLNELLATNAKVPVKTVEEFKALARSKPSAMNFGTLGQGSQPDMFLRWLNTQWGSKIVGVPYRGGGPIAQALAAGDIQLGKMGLGNFIGQVKAGRVTPLAVSSPKRSPLMPDVPTFAEVGLGEFPAKGWWGIVAPAGTPPDIIAKLNSEFVRLHRDDPKFTAFLEQQGVVPQAGSVEQFKEFLVKDREVANTLLTLANIQRKDYKPPQ
jgi:tripartite-type tricarboxylate transporter receptor subunit TctC